jgi:hypothetical protein
MPPASPADTPDAPSCFEKNESRIYHYILGMVHDPAEAEDLTQDTFLRAFQQRESLREAGALGAIQLMARLGNQPGMESKPGAASMKAPRSAGNWSRLALPTGSIASRALRRT